MNIFSGDLSYLHSKNSKSDGLCSQKDGATEVWSNSEYFIDI